MNKKLEKLPPRWNNKLVNIETVEIIYRPLGTEELRE